MPQTIHTILADSKVIFARGDGYFPSKPERAIFNAPRPLLGTELTRNVWCHGRFYVEVNLSEPHASEFVKRNNDLDARVVISVTDQEVVEMLLIDNKYASQYRERDFESQLAMLLPNISKIQHLPYGEAVALLDAAQAVIAADTADKNPSLVLPAGYSAVITFNVFLTHQEEDGEVVFHGSVAEANALLRQSVEVYGDCENGLSLIAGTGGAEGEEAAVYGVTYELRLTAAGEPIKLGLFTDPVEMVQSAIKLKALYSAD